MTQPTTEDLRTSELEFFLNTRINFGKHRGQTWAAVLEHAPAYIVWADENVTWLDIPSAVATEARANAAAQESSKRPEYKKPYNYDPLEDDYGYDPWSHDD